jgi:hypothetical protein
MPWTQQSDDVWTLTPDATQSGSGETGGTVRYRDGSWWAEAQPPTGGGDGFDTPGELSEGDFNEALAALPEPLGPFETADEAKSALEQAAQQS